jgi:hypothetical protein
MHPIPIDALFAPQCFHVLFLALRDWIPLGSHNGASKSILFVPMLAAPLDRESLRNAKVSLTRVQNFDGTLSEKG